jgi:hypothetical protein
VDQARRASWSLIRGTGHGTAGHEIPLQSAPSLQFVVLSVQVMLWEPGSKPLVMRRWVVLLTILAHKGITDRRWVMSHTTCVLSVSGVSAHLADLVAGPAPVLGVSGRLPCPNESR